NGVANERSIVSLLEGVRVLPEAEGTVHLPVHEAPSRAPLDDLGPPADGQPVRREHIVDRRSLLHRDRSRCEDPESEPRWREGFEVVGVGEECERGCGRQRNELRAFDPVWQRRGFLHGTCEDGREGHARATSSAAATRYSYTRRAPSRAQSWSVAPGPASASGTSRASRRSEAACASSRVGSKLETTAIAGFVVSAARVSVAIGVSAPRNRMRQPCERSTSANANRVMSCVSPGAQARSASGPVPRSQNRASAKSLPRMRLLAKCSWLISISPRSQPSPTCFRVGNSTWRSDSSRPN